MKKLMVIVAIVVLFTTAIQAQTQMSVRRIVMYPAPTAYCLSTNQNEIILNGSDKQVSYQIYTVDTTGKKIAVGMPVEGTGHSLTIPVEKQGIYTMEGTSDHGCSTKMTGFVKITEPDSISSMMPANGKFACSSYVPFPPATNESFFEVRDIIILLIFVIILGILLYGINNRLSK